MASYSFANCNCSIAGVGGNIQLGNGSGAAEEGLTIEHAADQNNLQIGADGTPMNARVINRASTLTVKMLKTSTANTLLAAMYNLQFVGGVGWGSNVVSLVDPTRFEQITMSDVAFKKPPTITYDKDGAMNEWTFDCGRTYISNLGG